MKDFLKKYNKAKYVIPALTLPAVLFIEWQICRFVDFEKPEQDNGLVTTETVNTALPDINEEKTSVGTKYQEMLRAYGKQSDYTSMENIEKEFEEDEEMEKVYSEEEKNTIDSLRTLLEQQKKLAEDARRVTIERERRAPQIGTGGSEARVNTGDSRIKNRNDELIEQMQTLQRIASGEKIMTESEKKAADSIARVQEIKQAILDSIAIAEAPKDTKKAREANERFFNSSKHGEEETGLIKARVDELVKAKDGSRLKLRLSEDIEIEGEILAKGSILYATVTGFTSQRVKAEVSSVMVGGKIQPVRLSVYDLDCMEGFYVPSSSFREMVQTAGGQAANVSVNMNSSSGNQTLEGVAMRSLQQTLQSVTSAVSGEIRKNRAKIKYNTEIYLMAKK